LAPADGQSGDRARLTVNGMDALKIDGGSLVADIRHADELDQIAARV
jgi:hypothetical protein